MLQLFSIYFPQLSLSACWHRLKSMLYVLFFVGVWTNLSVTNLLSQSTPIPNFNWVVQDIENRLLKGDHRAIRDLTNIWKTAPNNEELGDLARQYLMLTSEEFDWSGKDIPHRLQEFYYQKEQALQYSEFLKSYYLTPIESRKVDFNLEEQAFNWKDQLFIKISEKNIAYALKKKKSKILEQTILQVSELGLVMRTPILKDIALHPKFFKIKPSSKQTELLHLILEHLPDSTAINIVFQLGEKKKLSLNDCQQELANITNH